MVPLRVWNRPEPRPDWYPLGVPLKFSDNHPCPKKLGVPLPPPTPRASTSLKNLKIFISSSHLLINVHTVGNWKFPIIHSDMSQNVSIWQKWHVWLYSPLMQWILPQSILVWLWPCTFIISIYKLSDLGDIHILIGSLSQAIRQCPPPRRWIISARFEWHSVTKLATDNSLWGWNLTNLDDVIP